MAKDPAFLFYSNDFLTGVSDLTMEERGQYITLLCLEHQKGRLSEKAIKMVCHGIASADVMSKFLKDERGLFYNVRLEAEIKKRKEHSDKQRDRAVEGWKKRKENQSPGNATALPLENEIVIENKDEFKNRNADETFLWTEIVQNFKNDFRWKEKFCRDKNVRMEFLETKMDEFISDLELKEDLKDLKELKNHFTNWFNKHGKSATSNGEKKLDAMRDYINRRG